MNRIAAFLLVMLALGPMGLLAQTVPSFEQVLSVRTLSNPTISPDGQSVVYQVRTTDWSENGYDTELWMVRRGGAPFQLTNTPDGSSTSPQWSPDGQWLAFLANRGNQRQVHVLRAEGGEAQPVTFAENGVNSFRWSPEGTHLAYTMTAAEDQASKTRKDRYGAFDVEDESYRMSRLWMVPFSPDPWPTPAEAPCAHDDATDCARAPQAVCLTENADFTVNNFAWSPDGTKIVFEHRPDPLINSFFHADISIVHLADKSLRPVVERPGYDGSPIWSPDGDWLLFRTDDGNVTSNYYKNGQFAKVPARGGQPTILTTGFDENLSGLTWTRSGLYFVAWQKTERHFFHLDPNTGAVRPIATAPRNIWSFDFAEDEETLVFSAQTPTTLAEVYQANLSTWQPRRLTDMSRQLEGWTMGTSEVVTWTSQDGATIEGVLHKPDDFDPNRRYPLLVMIHGGPTGIDYPTAMLSYVYPVHQWLAKGALVLRPNYRGSAGYGEAFRSLNVRNLGVGDMWDVMSGVDHLIAQGHVDPERMGAMGWSQGGYISAFLTTNTNRFKAISVGAGISNWMTYYVNTDIHPFTRQYLQATPWSDPEVYAKTSPMTHINQASTPTLIQHGEFDRRVPIPNAYELYQGLEDVGVPAKLIVYKGFGHGISKPKERLAAVWHNWQWFNQYLWGEMTPLPLDNDQ